MNLARLFVEKRHIGWVALVATLVWGFFSYRALPQRKDPEVVIKTAVISTVWPGASAQDVEQLITRPLEQIAGQVPRVDKVTSTTRTGLSTIFVTLEDTARKSDLEPAWSDLQGRLDLAQRQLPAGTLAPQLNTHFGDTATVVYSVASPPVDAVELDLRADLILRVVVPHRESARYPHPGTTVFIPAPGVSRDRAVAAAERYLALGRARGALEAGAVLAGASFVAVDFDAADDAAVASLERAFYTEVVGGERPHPDVWGPVFFRDPGTLRARLEAAAGDKYSHRRLDEVTTLIRDELARLPEVGRVDRYGVVPERIYLLYSQERLASFGLHPRQLGEALKSRNVSLPAGAISTGKQVLLVDSASTVDELDELLDTVVANTRDGRPVELRDVVEVQRTYETPISDQSWLTWRDGETWRRTRSVAVAVQARSGVQITSLGEKLDRAVAALQVQLPDDLVVVKSTDQPELVSHKIGEFMRSLAEAVAIVIAIALLFMERRSAVLVAASIPLTLALTFGAMKLLGIELQQVSIAALIISLGLLVDDPVIAGDAINRELALGTRREKAAWLGPTRLAKAIMYATLTNVVAFAPLLLVSGSMGDFIYSLPVVVSIALVASRIVSMTFMPLLGYYLLRGQAGYEAALRSGGRAARIARKYNAITEWILDHKAVSAAGFLAFLVVGLAPAPWIKVQFFPEEAMTRFYVQVKAPEGSDVRETTQIAEAAQARVLATEGGKLERITTFVGNGGPRWWSNVSPEPKNPSYALMIVEAKNADDTRPMIGRLQRTLTQSVPGARFEVQRTSSGKPAVTPVEVRISGPDKDTLHSLADQTAKVLRAIPQTGEVSDDWGAEALELELAVDDPRANAAGITRADLASSTLMALTGQNLTQVREHDRLIDVMLRLRPEERAAASRLHDLYVWSSRTGRAVRLEQVAAVGHTLEAQKIVRYRQERTITVGAIPRDGELPSVLLEKAKGSLSQLQLPPGYRISYGGEEELQTTAFGAVSVALKVSVALIFLVLVWQFAHLFKPLIVFASIPFGLVGAVLGLRLSNTNFGFMAFLGVASLIGVIVSHIIVLFDFIEEAREEGVPLHRAVIDAGLVRLRPVLVTVLATVGGLIPLAVNGGPMWRQLVYVQIGGLLLATLVTKGVVPLLYVMFVETFGLVSWKPTPTEEEAAPVHRPVSTD